MIAERAYGEAGWGGEHGSRCASEDFGTVYNSEFRRAELVTDPG